MTSIRLHEQVFEFPTGTTRIMGVINLSPESRIRHTVAETPEAALEKARRYRDAGVSIIDLGGQSSHFEADELDAADEFRRLEPGLRLLVEDGFVVSVDTWKPAVAAAALEAGASIINDTGGLTNPAMVDLIGRTGAPAVLTYVEGADPHRVGDLEFAEDKAAQIAERLEPRIDELHRRGVANLIVDPGISINYPSDYGEYTRQQLRVIRSLDTLRAFGHPVLIPIPRKQEIGRVAAYITMALEYGADLIRVHDIELACDLARLFDRL